MGGHENESGDNAHLVISIVYTLCFVLDIQAPSGFFPGEMNSCTRTPSRVPHFQCEGKILYRVLSSLPMHGAYLGLTTGINFFFGLYVVWT